MKSLALSLPRGRQGRLLAIAITLLGLTLIWLAVVSPLSGWYESRAESLAQLQAVAGRMTALAREIPQLRQAVAASRPQARDRPILLVGATDAIAGANLQSLLQNLAQQAGTSLDSSEMLPVQQDGALRRIGLQVSMTATWPVLIGLLQDISTARPCMIVDGLAIMDSPDEENGADAVQANFSVSAFSAGSP